MGGIWMSGRSFWEGLADSVGLKSGLALGRDELRDILSGQRQFSRSIDMPADDEHGGRWDSAEYQEIFCFILYKVGRLEHPGVISPVVEIYRKYGDTERAQTAFAVCALFEETGGEARFYVPFDEKLFAETATKNFGDVGKSIAEEIIALCAASQVGNPYVGSREIEWDSALPLKDLFESEHVPAPPGPFIDQRYIDFLHRNGEKLDEIHWRKFEALTAEFFRHEGYTVELGPGRNDDGVDVRAWVEGSTKGDPPTIIAQCKRQTGTVDKVTLKGLYADLLHEGAQLGLIATTRRLSRGASEVARVRAYPIQEADRNTLAKWLEAMRKPGAGFIPLG